MLKAATARGLGPCSPRQLGCSAPPHPRLRPRSAQLQTFAASRNAATAADARVGAAGDGDGDMEGRIVEVVAGVERRILERMREQEQRLAAVTETQGQRTKDAVKKMVEPPGRGGVAAAPYRHPAAAGAGRNRRFAADATAGAGSRGQGRQRDRGVKWSGAHAGVGVGRPVGRKPT